MLAAELEQLPFDWARVLYNLDHRGIIEKSALELGIRGFFYLDDPVETLVRGLTAIFNGELWVSRQRMAEVILDNGFKLRQRQNTSQTSLRDLTRREVEILGLLSSGATNEIIADKLFISPHTVRTHLNHIFKKIDVSNRLQASIWAAEYIFA